jgi:hypothetical protein
MNTNSYVVFNISAATLSSGHEFCFNILQCQAEGFWCKNHTPDFVKKKITYFLLYISNLYVENV